MQLVHDTLSTEMIPARSDSCESVLSILSLWELYLRKTLRVLSVLVPEH
jgi:hypothetical protein